MTNLEQYALSISAEKWFEHAYCHGCDECPAKNYCHAQPEGTCCRENFFAWSTGLQEGANDD